MKAVVVRDTSQIAEARRVAVAVAQAHGFDEEDAGRVAIVASELATNLVKHGAGGELLVGSFDDETGAGVELLALDKGPGMADVAASSRDGHSTTGTPGNGLGAIRRGAHFSDIYSRAGEGAAVLARLSIGHPRHGKDPAAMPDVGAVSVPMPGEEACGDGWCRHDLPEGLVLMVSDGLGHGPYAADASHAAARSFRRTPQGRPSDTLSAMHGALRPTRGAAVAIARLDLAAKEIVYAGVGNIAGTVVASDGAVQRMVSNNGTVGHVAKHIRDFTYRLEGRSVVILASDGLATSWQLDRYPGLIHRHPTLIAGVLYRDFNRGRDDVTVLVGRAAA